MTAPAAPDEASTSFADLLLRPELIEALARLGYEEPTPIQREAIPPLLEGRDLLGQAATGTGKTAAFALPILESLEPGRQAVEPAALVLVPTRELAVQVSEALHRYGKALGARVLPIYGGQPIGRQLGALRRGVDVVVGTPGRVQDHISRGTLPLDQLRMVVLDEADEMLDMGFAEDIEAILQETPDDGQTVLFSATMPPRIDRIARQHLTDPVRIEIRRETAAGGSPLVRQTAYVVARAHKPAALGRVLDVESPTAAIVFCRTRDEVDTLTETLNGRGYRAEALHGGMTQEQRDRVMNRLRAGADRAAGRHRRRRPRPRRRHAHARRQLRRPLLPGVVRPPHRPRRPRRPRGRRDHARRAARAPLPEVDRADRQIEDPDREDPDGRRPARAQVGADARALAEVLTDDAGGEHDRLDRFRVVVETLTDEFDVMEVALAAVKLAHEALGGGGDEEEIPEPQAKPFKERPAARRRLASARAPRRPGAGLAVRAAASAARAARRPASTSASAAESGCARRTSSARSPASRS